MFYNQQTQGADEMEIQAEQAFEFLVQHLAQITPAFGYSAPHPSAGGTLTLLIHALPSAHYQSV